MDSAKEWNLPTAAEYWRLVEKKEERDLRFLTKKH